MHMQLKCVDPHRYQNVYICLIKKLIKRLAYILCSYYKIINLPIMAHKGLTHE